MLMAYLGDLMVTMTSHQSLDKSDPMPMHYTLHFQDVVTSRTAELSYETEMDAIKGFAAWLIADEGDVGRLLPYYERLSRDLPDWAMP